MAAPASASAGHHHRSTTKADHKPFKGRHASKSSVKNANKGKVESLSFERGSRKTPAQQVMSKIGRRNQAKQRRLNNQAEREEKGGIFAGRDGAPRIVAVVPLCEDVGSTEVLKGLNGSVDIEDEVPLGKAWMSEIPRFKQKVQYLTPGRDLLECLDACRLADFVLFVLSAEEEVDDLGEKMLRCIESQGVSTVLTGVVGLDKVEPAKKRPDVAKSLKSFINHFFAAQEKVHDLSSRQDCSNVMRSLCTTTPKGIRWREDRSWMYVEEMKWEGQEAVLTGTVRGRGLNPDRLVQVGEWGDYQVQKITAAPLASHKKPARANAMAVDTPDDAQLLDQPTENQDDLAELAPEEAMMDDAMTIPTASLAPSERKGVLLDDHHYFDDADREKLSIPKRLPRGTSKYQAAWYLGDVSDSGSDLTDYEDEEDLGIDDAASTGPADGDFDAVMREPTEAGAPSEYPQSEMFMDPAPEDEEEDLVAYRKQRRQEAEDDKEFPDEIELPPNVLARERLARYRGLKSLRTSAWETEEDKPYEPEEWTRLLEINDYKSAKNKVVKEALHGGIKPGMRINLHVTIPTGALGSIQALPQPTSLFSLLRHEHKRTSLNTSISLSSEYPAPLKSKETLIMQCGPRRLLINPLFSQAGNTPNNVHKFERFLHPGETAIGSFIGPMLWGSVPCLYFKSPAPEPTSADPVSDLAASMEQTTDKPASGLELIATGTLLPPATNRIIAKRIILTGHPYKIHKKLVTIRYMFFNAEDVEYFKALQLWTRRGRSGFVKETLGTHGYFKATFDGKVNPLDAVAVSMYKRVWPRSAVAWRPGMEIETEGRGEGEMDVEEAPELVGA